MHRLLALAISGAARFEPNCDYGGVKLEYTHSLDMSGTFEEDLEVMKDVMPDLVEELERLFPGSRYGLSSYVDKPIAQMGKSDRGDYCYRVDLPLEDGYDGFLEALDGLEALSGWDTPESQLDALLRIPLAGSGWTMNPDGTYPALDFDDRPLLRIVALSTDDTYHVAGDVAKDSKPRVDLPASTGTGLVDCAAEDYPEISSISDKLVYMDARILFLVTDDQVKRYEGLLDQLKVYGTVERITSDSDNLVEAVLSGIDDILCMKTTTTAEPPPSTTLEPESEESSESSESSESEVDPFPTVEPEPTLEPEPTVTPAPTEEPESSEEVPILPTDVPEEESSESELEPTEPVKPTQPGESTEEPVVPPTEEEDDDSSAAVAVGATLGAAAGLAAVGAVAYMVGIGPAASGAAATATAAPAGVEIAAQQREAFTDPSTFL